VAVVVAGRELAAIDAQQPQPVAGAQHLEEQPRLHVPAQEAVLEALEDPVPVQAEVGGGEAAARHRGDQVHLVEEPARLSIDGDLRLGELLEHAVGEGCGPRAAPGEGERQEDAAGALGGRECRFDESRPRIPRIDRLVPGRRREARDRSKSGECDESASDLHGDAHATARRQLRRPGIAIRR